MSLPGRSSRKRRSTPQYDIVVDESIGEVPCDTHVALLSLKQQFYHEASPFSVYATIAKRRVRKKRQDSKAVLKVNNRTSTASDNPPSIFPRVMFKTQLYATLQDHTLVDRELVAMNDHDKCRVFQLLHSKDECMVLLMDDYKAVIRSASVSVASNNSTVESRPSSTRPHGSAAGPSHDEPALQEILQRRQLTLGRRTPSVERTGNHGVIFEWFEHLVVSEHRDNLISRGALSRSFVAYFASETTSSNRDKHVNSDSSLQQSPKSARPKKRKKLNDAEVARETVDVSERTVAFLDVDDEDDDFLNHSVLDEGYYHNDFDRLGRESASASSTTTATVAMTAVTTPQATQKATTIATSPTPVRASSQVRRGIRPSPLPSSQSRAPVSYDQAVSLLLDVGLLVRHDTSDYRTWVPYAGSIVQCLMQGRKEVQASLKRVKYKEILLADLSKRHLQSSFLPVSKFHFLDLVGAGLVTGMETTSGTLVRLVQGR
eukprot:TRINITY_DN14878_c0_g1_i1.p1 TRINITY_DN14878_c0_g1~~TRINITY_DN14878_c0_g1_i1.p1  ORF type:complete len:488 (-),score=55.12 TRINITY_DN14878_c0_g1_i1:70-1533(-)